MNRQALQNSTNSKSKDLMIIPEANHLFDNNEGMVEEGTKMTSEWYSKNIAMDDHQSKCYLV
ncbi:MAG TPA: hypothetical protein VER14_09290 [Phototrophicaceae bacterium]|nr:hypothetical protein [Phototrophicaceae bacterium]